MSDQEGTPSTRQAEGPKQTLHQGVQLLPLLKTYFKTAGLLLVVWVVGYFGFSSSWIMIGLFFHIANEEYRKVKEAKHSFAQQAVKDEKKAILARVDELPSWVYFPDVERAEWLNKAIKQMWPYIGEYVKDLLITTVEPSVQQSLPNSLKPFKFEKIDLGDLPPRIGGVKVYTERVRRDEVIMDMEIFYASDTQITVAVRGLNAGIKDLTIHGTIRVVMKPLVKVMPIIGGLSCFFLNPPTVDFDLTNTANLLDLPLLSNTLRTIVEDQISYYLVLPNKIPVQLIQNLDMTALKFPMPAGVIRLHIVAGRELKRADVNLFGKGKSDPYIKMYIGAQTMKTRVINDTVNPVWNQYFEAVVDQEHGQFVEMECLDQDPGEDDELGTASVDLSQVVRTGSMDTWLPLENVSTGMIHIRALWLHLSKDPDDLEKEERLRKARALNDINIGASKKSYKETVRSGSEDTLSTALLMVSLDSAKGLPLQRSKKSLGEPSPYAKVSIGNDTRKTIPQAKTDKPTWEENFHFLIHNVQLQVLQVEIFDSAKKDKKLGVMTYPIKNLLSAKDLTVNRPFQLRDSTPTAKVHLRLCLRVLTSELPADWDEEAHIPDIPAAAGAEDDEEEAADADADAEEGDKDSNDNVAPGDTVEKSQGEDVSAMADTSSMASAMTERPGQEIRQRKVATPSMSSSGGRFGQIQITLRYSSARGKLIIVIHKCVNLIPCDDDNLADPYVRCYLLPEKSSSSKRKTQTVKNNLNPIYDETFEWSIGLTEVATRTLDVLVKNSVSVFSSNRTHMGRVMIDLSQADTSQAQTAWYDLEDPAQEDKD